MAGNHYPYRVLSSRLVTPVIRALELAPEQAALPYRAGQYVLLGDPGQRLPPRSYSVANAPRADGVVDLLVTLVPGGVITGWVHERLRPGHRVRLTGPYGTFLPDADQAGPVLLLAAGSGIAPARALAEALLDTPQPRPVTLFFSARGRADTIDDTRWRDWANSRKDFHYLLTLTRDPGAPKHPRIPDLLPVEFGDLKGWEVFVSGPPAFVTGCAAVAETLGAERAAIRTEEFFTEPQPWTRLPPVAAKQETPR
ncbi:MAG: hypothetical protein EPN38_04815 [Rhodanobacteraceae bacterium]|nr:MAG: hypothetical protein EPN38_04815 [Rhodanobacteraceae bacterium]